MPPTTPGPEDQRPATYRHIQQVQAYLLAVSKELSDRALIHDQSKLHDPERSYFDEYTPKLRDITYGSPEYDRCLAEMQPALDHHYAHNPHHPEHHPDGIHGMTFIDLLEMLVDWKAATLRHADGDIFASIEKNQARFKYSDELKRFLINTALWLEQLPVPNFEAVPAPTTAAAESPEETTD